MITVHVNSFQLKCEFMNNYEDARTSAEMYIDYVNTYTGLFILFCCCMSDTGNFSMDFHYAAIRPYSCALLTNLSQTT